MRLQQHVYWLSYLYRLLHTFFDYWQWVIVSATFTGVETLALSDSVNVNVEVFLTMVSDAMDVMDELTEKSCENHGQMFVLN